jgi:hypothetical protein
MTDFKNTIKLKNDNCQADIEIQYKDGRLSISADGRWLDKTGGLFGGQSYDTIFDEFPKYARLVELWKRWHLNDMNAGDELQETYLRAHGRGKDYEETCAILEKAGLLIHDGYKYGSEWKAEKVPTDVLDELRGMA